MRTGLLELAILSLPLIAACSDGPTPTTEWSPADHAQPPQQQVDPSRVPRQTPARPAEGEGPAGTEAAAATLWRLSCAGCHGVEGRGDGPSYDGELADLSDPEWQASVSDEDIARVITLGSPPMPAFGQMIRPAGIAALVEHVRRLPQAAPQPNEAGAAEAASDEE